MSTWIDFGGDVELRDAQGRVFKLALAEPAADEATAEVVRLRKEVEQLRAQLHAAQAVGKRLEAEKAEIAEERDGYLKSLHYLTRKDFTFTAEEIADLDKNGVEFN